MAMAKHASKAERTRIRVGRLLAHSEFLLIILGAYVALAIIIYGWLVIDLQRWRGYPTLILYDVAFGGSPLAYMTVLSDFPWLWQTLKLFHFFAWLIVPLF